MIIPRLELILAVFGDIRVALAANMLTVVVTVSCLITQTACFCGDTAWKSSFSPIEKSRVYDFISVITYMVKIGPFAHRAGADCFANGQGGNGEEADYYDPRYSDMFFTERATNYSNYYPNPILAMCAKHS